MAYSQTTSRRTARGLGDYLKMCVEPGVVLGSRHRIETRIGEGGMGVVFRAHHVDLELPVAIKVMRPELAAQVAVAERFVDEARAMAAIRSDHVVRVIDVARLTDGTPYLVLEYVDGPDLESFLQIHGALSTVDTIGFALDACAGLHAAHARGIVHRDVKPANLLVDTARGGAHRIKISDFGIATRIELERTSMERIRTATVGSPLYMAPEQMRNDPSIDGRADVWSLGVVMYEMSTGCVPFTGADLETVCSNVLRSRAVDPRDLRADIPPALAQVILRCLEPDREDRFPDVVELARELGRIRIPVGEESHRVADGARVDVTIEAPRRTPRISHAAPRAPRMVLRLDVPPPPTNERSGVGRALRVASALGVAAALVFGARHVASARGLPAFRLDLDAIRALVSKPADAARPIARADATPPPAVAVVPSGETCATETEDYASVGPVDPVERLAPTPSIENGERPSEEVVAPSPRRTRTRDARSEPDDVILVVAPSVASAVPEAPVPADTVAAARPAAPSDAAPAFTAP